MNTKYSLVTKSCSRIKTKKKNQISRLTREDFEHLLEEHSYWVKFYRRRNDKEGIRRNLIIVTALCHYVDTEYQLTTKKKYKNL